MHHETCFVEDTGYTDTKILYPTTRPPIFGSILHSLNTQQYKSLCDIPIQKKQQQTARNLIMTEDEITAILDKAHGCVESECAVNDVEDLITELKDQQKVLSTRLETIMNVVAHLQHANEQEKRKTDDVRAIVKDMLRVFTTSVSFLVLCYFWGLLIVWEWRGLCV